jgi:hypothetical protein
MLVLDIGTIGGLAAGEARAWLHALSRILIAGIRESGGSRIFVFQVFGSEERHEKFPCKSSASPYLRL